MAYILLQFHPAFVLNITIAMRYDSLRAITDSTLHPHTQK